MNDILKALRAIDAAESKKTLNESAVAECGDMPPAPAQNTGSPVTVSVNFNASGAEHVSELLGLLKNAGVESSPVSSMSMDNPMIPGQDHDDDDTDIRNGMMGAMAGGSAGTKIGSAVSNIMTDDEMESFVNEPDEKYQDHNYMTKDLSGGINREKRMHKPAAGGDNPMAVESIKDRLMKALDEAKSKPDFLDVDKDGDRKEPMKKALKDKGSAPKKGKVPPQFAKKTTKESADGVSDAERNPSIEKSKYKSTNNYSPAKSAGDRAAEAYLKRHPGDYMGAAKAKKEANMGF
jgi:hypothetical protein